MCSLYILVAGNRLSTQVRSLVPSGAPAGASLNSAMTTLQCLLRFGDPVGSGLLVFADQQARVGEVHVRRHFEVVRRRLVLEDAARDVEGGAVAGAEEAALPVVGQRGLGAGLQLVGRRTAQVRADANGDE